MAFLQQIRRHVVLKKTELGGAIVFALAIIGFASFYDVQMHDRFVLTSYGCDQSPTKPECQPITGTTRYSLNIQDTSFSYEIQGRTWYWILFSAIIWAFAIMIYFFRGYIMKNVEAGLLWAITVILPFYSGFEDLGYFAIKGEGVPAALPWLNGNPFINLFANGQPATSNTLYTAVIASVIILAVAWGLALRKRR